MNVILHKFILTLPCHFFLHAAVCILGSKREQFQHEMAMKASSVWFANSNEFCNKPDIEQYKDD